MEDFLPLKRIDYIEFFCGNAKQSAIYYQYAFGFKLTAYSGLETGNREFASYLLEQGKIRFILTTAYHDTGFIPEHVKLHGDGVRDVAFEVDDAAKSFNETVKRGAVPVVEPTEFKDDLGTIIKSSIKTFGDTLHSFIERKNYNGLFLPGFVDASHKSLKGITDTNLKAVDHMVGNVELGNMLTWVEFYAKVLGFNQLLSFDDKDISTEYTALMSKVMQNSTGKIKIPINEPAKGKKKSQIEEYLDFYKSPGIQHIALATPDILGTVNSLRERGVEFLTVPTTYYSELEGRVGKIDEDVQSLQDLGILVDKDDDGYLLQIFTKPVEDRPTLFFEIIQRKGARSFGKGNFKALFESIEREQALRGTLENDTTEDAITDDLLDLQIINGLKELGSNDNSFFKEIIDLYIAQYPELIDKIKNYNKTQDFENLSKSAHALKGASLNIGAKKLADVCKTIELNSHEKHSMEYGELIQEIESLYKITISELQKL